MKTPLRTATGYTRSEWARKLQVLYNDAKRRHDGNSLSIYGRVGAMLDRLDGPLPDEESDAFDALARELNDLAGDLRRA